MSNITTYGFFSMTSARKKQYVLVYRDWIEQEVMVTEAFRGSSLDDVIDNSNKLLAPDSKYIGIISTFVRKEQFCEPY